MFGFIYRNLNWNWLWTRKRIWIWKKINTIQLSEVQNIRIKKNSTQQFGKMNADDSVFSDENRETEFISEDLPPKQKRAFVKMLAKFIRCAIHWITQFTFFFSIMCLWLNWRVGMIHSSFYFFVLITTEINERTIFFFLLHFKK